MNVRIAAGVMLALAATAPQAAPETNPTAGPAAATAAGSAAGSAVTAVYDFYFGGFRAAEMTIAAEYGPDSYQATGSFKTRGFVAFFADTKLDSVTVGKVEADGLVPLHYRSDEREDDGSQLVEVMFSGDGPSAVRATPEFKDKPWSIEAQDQRGVIDPLSAVLTTLAPRPVDAVCGRRIEAFDGQHRFAFEIGAPERTESGIRCHGAFVRLAGYKPKKMGPNARQPFTITLAERPGGGYQVVRLTSETDYGVAVMRLRD